MRDSTLCVQIFGDNVLPCFVDKVSLMVAKNSVVHRASGMTKLLIARISTSFI